MFYKTVAWNVFLLTWHPRMCSSFEKHISDDIWSDWNLAILFLANHFLKPACQHCVDLSVEVKFSQLSYHWGFPKIPNEIELFLGISYDSTSLVSSDLSILDVILDSGDMLRGCSLAWAWWTAVVLIRMIWSVEMSLYFWLCLKDCARSTNELECPSWT